jgi:predicted acetyltransferase
VDPSQQSKGFGSALLQHTLIQFDRDNKLAYLESSNPRNIPLYKRHGFELLGSIQIGTSPSIAQCCADLNSGSNINVSASGRISINIVMLANVSTPIAIYN